MAPRAASKAKNHKSKGEKKKKEDKLLPTVLDILVNLPSGEEIILKGISTDRVLDVRKLLAVNVETCHLTNFSLSHQVRGDHLSDSQEIIHLKPCVLTLVEEAYTKDEAVVHVRRLLDIVACTTSFGPSGKSVEVQDDTTTANAKQVSTGEAASVQDFADVARLCPPSKLGTFYEFFSFAHLKSPVQAIRKFSLQGGTKDFFSLEVKVSNGKLFTVTACSGGFYHGGKQYAKSHTLVDLLRHLSKAFDDAYDELLKGFGERNKFANIPYNLRANTWLVPPIAAESPSVFPSLPAEDESWGGSGGGRGRTVGSLEKPWASLFALVAKMPCATAEEREVRDHKAFILHNYFVDVATTHAVDLIKELDCKRNATVFGGQHVDTRGTLKFTVTLDSCDPCKKALWKIDSSISEEQSQESISEKNLLKGITADESTVAHDLTTLGVVLVRHQGYKAAVEAVFSGTQTCTFDVLEPPEGGANALNANSLRTLLHKSVKTPDDDSHAKELVRNILKKGIEKMSAQEPASANQFIRWELGACWIQHLGEKKDKSSTKEPNCKEDDKSPLKEILSKTSLERLRETGTGLHLKVLPDLLNEAQHYYNDVALPKLVTDFAALELSPVEGRTLTDFMHIRGLRISSLGHLADLCAKLPHIRSLCIHEMIIRALKHLVRAIVASVKDTEELALTLATALNAIFGQLPAEGTDNVVWKWLVLFVKSRFGWRLAQDSWLHLRKYAVLRGLCYKVGIEMVSRDYDFQSLAPFTKADIISMVPVYKHAICSSADGRTLLESSKTALDKGKLEDAVSYGSKALAKLIAVCGPYHRMTAGAYSLLAVVLYHTGDFIQAMTYQQKALDINERELGLDHPDTMKSYGDLAVFYYRLQHTELALRYVNRALYLLHLICGPSHPNTAATYINVAMMEEALGNAHVALRYLHEALKCNERLLGKDHIQTAASYHAIAIALSLMEAYTLSVHHEQTTFQILQAKLGPDDIRTQDAAAWLEYFDSKAVEQQEAARTGAPKPDPNVASKGHLSVSDLLDYINAGIAETNDKDVKKAKRLKILSNKDENKNGADGIEDDSKTPKSEGGTSKEQPEQSQQSKQIISGEQPQITSEEHSELKQKSQESRQPSTQQHEAKPELSSEFLQLGHHYIPPLSDHTDAEDGGWLEATSKGKHHRKLFQKSYYPPTNVHASIASSRKTLSNDSTSAGSNVKKEKEAVLQVVIPSVAVSGDQARSYRDVALMSKNAQVGRRSTQPQQISTPRADDLKVKSDGGEENTKSDTTTQKSDIEDDSVSQTSSASQAVEQSPSPAVAVTPLKPVVGKAAESHPRPPAAGTGVQASTTTVAVTPIRKQVLQLPSNASQACIPRGSAAAAAAELSPASPPLHAAAALAATVTTTSTAAAAATATVTTTSNAAAATAGPGNKRPMNPLAIEFVPGRKWHPFSPTSGTNNTLQTGGTGADAEKQEEKEESQSGVKTESDHPQQDDQKQEQQQQQVAVQEFTEAQPAAAEDTNSKLGAAEVPFPENSTGLERGIQLSDNEEKKRPVKAPSHSSWYYSSDSNCTEERSEDSSEGNHGDRGEFKPVSKKQSSSNGSRLRSKSKSRWQRRSDGAITRVYRMQGGKSNPQLRTTSTFTDVPEPHTLQPAPIMRRSVRVS